MLYAGSERHLEPEVSPENAVGEGEGGEALFRKPQREEKGVRKKNKGERLCQ